MPGSLFYSNVNVHTFFFLKLPHSLATVTFCSGSTERIRPSFNEIFLHATQSVPSVRFCLSRAVWHTIRCCNRAGAHVSELWLCFEEGISSRLPCLLLPLRTGGHLHARLIKNRNAAILFSHYLFMKFIVVFSCFYMGHLNPVYKTLGANSPGKG